MIVEFIGSTGAGKTTLLSGVRRSLAQTTAVTTSFDLMAVPLGLSRVSQPTAKNLLQELVGLPFLLRSLPGHREFIYFILRMLARQASLSIFTVNNLRSLARKLGMYEICRRRNNGRIVLVDEGTVLTAHNVFVYSSVRYQAAEIEKFAALVPLPDVIVYVRAPRESLVERTLQRSDPPRELRSRDRAQVEKSVTRAAAMFDQLVKCDAIRSRVFIVDNLDSGGETSDAIVETITEFLMNVESSNPLNLASEGLLQAEHSLERAPDVK